MITELDFLERRASVHRALGEPHRLAIVDALALSDRTPSELGRATGLGSNLLSFHLDVLEDAGIVVRTPSEGDRRRRYVRLLPGALPGLAPLHAPAVTGDGVLFVCTHNSARSLLAEALWERRTGRAAGSAGHRPAAGVHPLARDVARAHGLDLEGRVPRGYDEVDVTPGLVVSVCDRAREAGLPFRVVPSQALHWSVPDPVGGTRADFEAVHDELVVRVDRLAACLAEVA